ncbi:MAG TPA: DUF481 domain-containing protein [Terracidiphilus sp.]|nr:DUF481 domain-containing protein [Terracidiphilus sp.]
MTSYVLRIPVQLRSAACALLAMVLGTSLAVNVKAEPVKTPAAPPDVLVLSDGDVLHGKFVNAIGGKVTFHTDSLGDVTLTWDKIKELHTTGKFGVLEQSANPKGKHTATNLPTGTVDVSGGKLTVNAQGAPAPLPVAKAQFVMDEAILRKQVLSEPGFFAGWNGAATAGATVVSSTTDQYTFSGALNLVRTVPVVPWLNPRNKTLFAFNESYGKITQPAYSYPATPPATGTVPVPAVVTKSSISHAGAERDEYFSPRVYALVQVAFDHNFAQDLQLQQIYGGGFGWTVMKKPNQEFDLKGTVQYEKQQFIPNTGNMNQDLVGSTFTAIYLLHVKKVNISQAVSYIPAYNMMNAYSANETNTVAFPAFKGLSFSLGTLDTYLNDAPFGATASNPPTKPNSFQFTMGLTYAIKSKY